MRDAPPGLFRCLGGDLGAGTVLFEDCTALEALGERDEVEAAGPATCASSSNFARFRGDLLLEYSLLSLRSLRLGSAIPLRELGRLLLGSPFFPSLFVLFCLPAIPVSSFFVSVSFVSFKRFADRALFGAGFR